MDHSAFYRSFFFMLGLDEQMGGISLMGYIYNYMYWLAKLRK